MLHMANGPFHRIQREAIIWPVWTADSSAGGLHFFHKWYSKFNSIPNLKDSDGKLSIGHSAIIETPPILSSLFRKSQFC